MINDETRRKLRELGMNEFVEILDVQQNDPFTVSLSFDERMQRIVDYVHQQKYNKRISNLIRSARFRFVQADIYSLDYRDRGFDRSLIQELTAGGYLQNHTNIICQGYTGSGKTFLACALGKEACNHMKKVRYIRLPDLLVTYDDQKNMGVRYVEKLLKKFARFEVLIIDEWLLEDLSEEEAHFIFELIERRYDSCSTIFCTQYRKENWLDRLGNNVHAEAITDRIVHNAIWINMGDRNMRESQLNSLGTR